MCMTERTQWSDAVLHLGNLILRFQQPGLKDMGCSSCNVGLVCMTKGAQWFVAVFHLGIYHSLYVNGSDEFELEFSGSSEPKL